MWSPLFYRLKQLWIDSQFNRCAKSLTINDSFYLGLVWLPRIFFTCISAFTVWDSLPYRKSTHTCILNYMCFACLANHAVAGGKKIHKKNIYLRRYYFLHMFSLKKICFILHVYCSQTVNCHFFTYVFEIHM